MLTTILHVTFVLAAILYFAACRYEIATFDSMTAVIHALSAILNLYGLLS